MMQALRHRQRPSPGALVVLFFKRATSKPDTAYGALEKGVTAIQTVGLLAMPPLC